MRRLTGVLVLVLVVSLVGASDVRGGGAALTAAGKTTGPALTATIVTDVTGISGASGKGLTSIRVQKAGTITAALFTSSYVNSFVNECFAPPLDLQATTNNRFLGPGGSAGLIDGFIDVPEVLESLFLPFGTPSKAAISDIDYPTCTTVNHGFGVVRKVLSFTAVIQFQP